MTAPTLIGQTDIFTEMRELDEQANGVPRLFASFHRDLTAYCDDLDNWISRHGHFGCLRQSHAWHTLDIGSADRAAVQSTKACTPVLFAADTRCDHSYGTRCFCVGNLLYRCACRCCGWHSEITGHENEAVILGMDHCYPGWRSSPVVAPQPVMGTAAGAAYTRWKEGVMDAYGERPDGWPIITRRGERGGYRAVPGRSPWGGYDIAEETLRP